MKIEELYPDKATYRPGETATLHLTLRRSKPPTFQGTLQVTLCFLADSVGTIQSDLRLEVEPKQLELQLPLPPVNGRGYGVEVTVLDATEQVVARGATALDVLNDWTMAPRYGFLSDFPPGRSDSEATIGWLVKHHINGLQFYDWLYRHDTPVATGMYEDPLGRPLSRDTIESLIQTAQRHNIASMAYVAVYAASVPFYRAHPTWALYDSDGQPIPFGEDFLYLMNPAAGSRWTTHQMKQFKKVLGELNFDGIHIDQYGHPKEGYTLAGWPVDLPDAFRSFINQTRETLKPLKPNVPVLFNAVGNWPIEALTASRQSFSYIEVWPPDTQYADLWRLITQATRLSEGKPVVLAAYLAPAHPHNVRLADAVIFASGGYHIELGEPGRMLADPYFPQHEPVEASLAAVLRRYYDFLVRYENLLCLDTRDVTTERAGRIRIEGVPVSHNGAPDTIWAIVREGNNLEVLHLLNLMDVATSEWTEPLPAAPTELAALQVRYDSERAVQRIWLASPDSPSLRATPLHFSQDGAPGEESIAFLVPRLAYWTMVVLEYETPITGR